SFNGFANYNHANFTNFTSAPCYAGQTAAQGCVASRQDFTGKVLTRAPRFVAQFGFDYATAVSGDYSAGIGVNGNYSSSYYATAEHNPTGLQKPYVTLDATLRF